MGAVLLDPVTRWACPNCNFTDVTRESRVHVRMHVCPGLKGVTAPAVVEGTACKVEARAREDYENGDLTQHDDEGRSIMSVVTTRDEGQDCMVLASTATARS